MTGQSFAQERRQWSLTQYSETVSGRDLVGLVEAECVFEETACDDRLTKIVCEHPSSLAAVNFAIGHEKQDAALPHPSEKPGQDRSTQCRKVQAQLHVKPLVTSQKYTSSTLLQP